MGRRVRAGLATAVLTAGAFGLVSTPAEAQEPTVEATGRIGSDDPRQTAVLVSQAACGDDAARHVVLTRDDKFPDALAGTVLLGDGPMLLTATAALSATVRDELDRVLPAGGLVYVLGGDNAVGPGVESELTGAGYEVRRLAGSDRISTSLAIAREALALGASTFPVALARATGPLDDPDGTAAWADSVAAGAWLAAFQTPIVLTPTPSLRADVAAFFSDLAQSGGVGAVLLGGDNAIAPAVENDLGAAGVEFVDRIAGHNRAATAAALVNETTGGFDVPYVVVNGYADDGWAFGLPAAGYASSVGGRILYAARDALPDVTEAVVRSCGTKSQSTMVVGGAASISDTVRSAIEAADGVDCSRGTEGATFIPVHVVPADGSPVPDIEAAISHELTLVDDWFAAQHPLGRGLNFPRRADGRIAPRTVQLPQTSGQLDDPREISPALDAAGVGDGDDAFIVYIDVPADGGECGSSAMAATVLFMPSCNIYPSASTGRFPFGASYLAAHEMTHTLGAVDGRAPNIAGFGHVGDSNRDILYEGPLERDWENLVLDVNNDDYFLHDNGYHDIVDSGLWSG